MTRRLGIGQPSQPINNRSLNLLRNVREKSNLPRPAKLGDGNGNTRFPSRSVTGDTSHYGKYYIRLQVVNANDSNEAQFVPTWAWGGTAGFLEWDGSDIFVQPHPEALDEWVIVGTNTRALAEAQINPIDLNPLAPQNKWMLMRDIADAQIIPVGTRATSSMFVTVHEPYSMLYNGAVQYLDDTLTLDLTPFVPTSGSRFVLTYYDPELQALGAVKTTTSAFTAEDVRIPSTALSELGRQINNIQLALNVYYLNEDTGAIEWTNHREDMRQFLRIQHRGFTHTITHHVAVASNYQQVIYGDLTIEDDGELSIYDDGELILTDETTT